MRAAQGERGSDPLRLWQDAEIAGWNSSGRACPVESTCVDVHGINTHFLTAGAGAPMVLVHGGGSGAVAWSSIIPRLARRFRVIAPDVVGFGATDKPRGPYDRRYFASWLSGFLDALSLGRAALVGHSLGGAIALQLALDHPSRIDRLALVSPAGLGWNLPPAPLFRSVVFQVAPGETTARRMHTTFVENPTTLHDGLLRYAAEVCRARGGRRPALHGNVKAVIPFRDAQLSRLRVPSLVIWGANDRVFSAERGARAARALPDARLRIIEGAGHIPFYDQPDAVVGCLLEFLEV